jgi:tetratricopeptide (TPR) repeat protein
MNHEAAAASPGVARPPPGVKSPAGDGRITPAAWTALAVAAILLAGLAAYSNTFRCPFIFDDKIFVNQPAAQHLWPIRPLLKAPRPVAQFTLALSHSLGGEVWGYHAFNLAVHLLAALTLFGVVRRTLTLPALSRAGGPSPAADFSRDSTALAFCIALLWALHPLQTESVTYIIQRMESLMGLFYLLTLYCFIRAVSHQDTHSPGTATDSPFSGVLVSGWRKKWYAAAVLACALGMGSKEVMGTAPVAVLLYDRTFIAGSFGEALRRRWRFYIALAATWLILTRQIIEALAPQGKSAGFGVAGVTPFEYARSEPGVILHYLRLAFQPSGLCLDYGWPVARTAGDILPGAFVVGGLLAVTVLALVRQRAWGFIGAWFFLALAPTSSILPIRDLEFDHRMYLPLAAVVAAVVLTAYKVTHMRLRRGMALALALTPAAALGCLTFQRNQDYRTEVSIWQDTVNKRQDNASAWNNLGAAYFRAGRYDKSAWCFDRSIELDRNYADPYSNRGNIYLHEGLCELAIRDYDRAIALKPDFALAYYNRGKARAATGHAAEAVADYDKAISLDPDYADTYYSRGDAYARLGRYDEAIADFDRVIELKPDYATAYNDRANACACLGRFDAALRDYDRAIEADPGYATARFNRANIRAGQGRLEEAIQDYSRAITLKPNYAEAYNNRAIAYYDLKEFSKAWADVKMSEKLGGRPNAEFLKALERAAVRPE